MSVTITIYTKEMADRVEAALNAAGLMPMRAGATNIVQEIPLSIRYRRQQRGIVTVGGTDYNAAGFPPPPIDTGDLDVSRQQTAGRGALPSVPTIPRYLESGLPPADTGCGTAVRIVATD